MTQLVLSCVLLVVPLVARADGGSNYTIFGIGDLRLSGTVRSTGMGYTGIGVAEPGGINLNAPATWSTISSTRIEAGYLYEGFNASDGSKSLYLATGNFGGASIAIPVSPANGIVFAGGFAPYSNQDFSVFTTGSQLGIDYTLNQTGSGGIGRAIAGLTYTPLPTVAIGASFNYLFGSIENSRILTPTSTTYAGGQTTETSSGNGITATFSGLFTGFGSLTPALQPLSLGFVVTSRGVLDTERSLLYRTAGEADSSVTITGETVVPLSYGAGASFRPAAQWLVAADFMTQLWSHSPVAGNARNSELFGVGIERLPSRESGASWTDKISYRLGFYHHATYYQVNGTPINEWAITAGFGVPISGDNRLNTAIEYGGRGETSNNLIKERIIRVSLSLLLGETWFVRYEED